MKYITLLSLFYLALSAQQKDFLLTIDKPFDAVLYDATQNYDDTVTAVGFSNRYKQTKKHKVYTNAFDYLADTSENLFGKKSILLNISNDGAIQYEKFAKISDFNEAVSVLKTPQNGYFLGGYTFSGSLLFAKLDENANTLFVKKFGTKNYDRMNALVKLSDGGVLAVGSSTTSRDLYDPMFRTGLGLNDIFLTRFDANGRMLWSKKYGTEYDDSGIDAAEALDGSILLLASTTYDKHHDITLMRIGENGNKIWLKHFKSDIHLTPKRLIRLHDGNFVAVLTQKDEIGKKQIRLIKFDLQKNLLLDKTLSTYYESELNDIKEYSNGNFIGVGDTKDRYNTDAYVMLLDENFNMLCQEHFGQENYDLFNGVTILRNSNAMAVGLTTPEGSQVKHMYIAKIQPDCTLAKLSSKPALVSQKAKLDLYKELNTLFAKELAKKEITLSRNLEIALTAPALLFQVGQSRLNKKQKDFLDQFCTKLIPFLQKHKNSIATLEIIGHTSSEWESANRFDERYLNNMDLSLKRAYNTTRHIIKNADAPTQKLLSQILKNSGYSFAKKVTFDKKEDRKRSRRIVFGIVTK